MTLGPYKVQIQVFERILAELWPNQPNSKTTH